MFVTVNYLAVSILKMRLHQVTFHARYLNFESNELSEQSRTFNICPVDRASSLQPVSTSKMRPASVWLLAAACHVSPGYEYHVYLGPRSGEPVTNFWQSTGAELDT